MATNPNIIDTNPVNPDLEHQIAGIRYTAQILADMLDQALEAIPETVLIRVDREHLSFLSNDLCARATALERAIV